MYGCAVGDDATAAAQKNENDMNRIERCKETYTSLFGGEGFDG